jgi:hypothetical protein
MGLCQEQIGSVDFDIQMIYLLAIATYPLRVRDRR